jgi:hypothetical protein
MPPLDGTSRTWHAGIVLLAALLVGCPPVKPSERIERGEHVSQTARDDERQVAVRVDGESVTRSEIERRIQQMPEYARVQYRTVEKQRSHLTSVVQFEIMADVAESRGLGQRPHVLDAFETALAERHVRRTLRNRDVSMQSIDEAVIRQRYRDEHRQPERRRVAVVAARDRDRLDSIRRDLAERSYDSRGERIRAFRRAASRYSNHLSAPKGGDIGFVRPPDRDAEHPELARAIYRLDEMGDLSPILSFDGRFAIAIYYQETSPTELEAVARRIRSNLYERRKRQIERETIDRWQQSTSISTHPEVLEGLTEPSATRTTRLDEIPLVRTNESTTSPSGDAGSP